MLGVKRGTVKLEKYNPNWKAEFEKEKSFIKGIFQDTILDIQHIGSTSIPNLISKPLIDIAIKVEDLNFSDKLTNDLISNNYMVVSTIVCLGFKLKVSDNLKSLIKAREIC